MFGLKVYQKQYVERLEKELNYYQGLYDQERQRGDRLTDQLLVNNGALPATETVRSEIRESRIKMAPTMEEQQKFLSEIAADMLSNTETEDEYNEMLVKPEEIAEIMKEDE